jgi:hypothetical protein
VWMEHHPATTPPLACERLHPPTPRCRRGEAGASPPKGTRRAPCRRTEETAMMSAWWEKEAAPMQRWRGRPRVRGGPPGVARASDWAQAWASWAIRASCSGELWSTPDGAFPSSRANREQRGPSRRTASWRRQPMRRSYAGGGPDGRMRSLGDPHGRALGAPRGRPGRARREGTSPADTSWPRPAARCEPTGGWTGRPRGGRLAARVSEGGDLRRDPVLKGGPGGLR